MPAISRFFVIFRHFSSFFVPFLFFLVDLDVLDFSFQFARLDVDTFDSVANAKAFCLRWRTFGWSWAPVWRVPGRLRRLVMGRVFGRMAGRLLWLVLHVGSSVAQVLVFCFWRANGPVMGRVFGRMAGRLLWLVLHVVGRVARVPVFCFWGANGPVMGRVFVRRRGRGLGLSESGFGTDDGCLNYELQWPVVRTMIYLISLMDTVF